jgi:hypothetical protein
MIKRLSKFIILWSLVCTTFSAKTNQKLCNTYTVQQGKGIMFQVDLKYFKIKLFQIQRGHLL